MVTGEQFLKAIENKDLRVIQQYADGGGDLYYARCDEWGLDWDALHIAVVLEPIDYGVVKLLMDIGCDPFHVGRTGDTPWRWSGKTDEGLFNILHPSCLICGKNNYIYGQNFLKEIQLESLKETVWVCQYDKCSDVPIDDLKRLFKTKQRGD